MSRSYTKEKKKGEVVYVCDLLAVSVRELEYEMKTTRQVTSPKATYTHLPQYLINIIEIFSYDSGGRDLERF